MSNIRRNHLDVARLREALDYNPETGALTWRERPLSHFNVGGGHSAEIRQLLWNSKYAGKPALVTRDPRGYFGGSFEQRRLWAHRAAWCILHGIDPDGEIDHINRNKGDNRARNLRLVTHSQNSKNRAKSPRNSSGVTGVTFRPRDNRWRAFIGHERQFLSLGEYRTFEEACAARKTAEAAYGFDASHGV